MAETLPHPTLPSLHGLQRPGWHEMENMKLKLNEDAIALTSAGNGILGHLVLTVSPATYLLQSNNVAFIVPVNPGVHAVVPDGSTLHQMTQINRTFDIQTKQWKEYTAANLTLKTLLLAAVPDKYIRSLADKTTGYTNVTIRTILDHLDAKFSIISDEDLRTNYKDLERDWSTADPLDTLWAHIEKCRDLATAGGNPITDRSAIVAVLKVLETTGQFSLAIHEWHQKTAADKTYDNLVLHFEEADIERLRILTVRNAGYQGTALLAATDATTAPPAEQALLAPAATQSTTGQMYYCFTHGLTSTSTHTSQTCERPCEGHVKTATAHDMKGGCNLIQRRREERAVWKPKPRRANPAPAATN